VGVSVVLVLAVLVFHVGQEPLVLRRTGIASISMAVGLSQHPTSTAWSVRSSSQSIRSSAKARLSG
jgi:hypothetical protein